MFNYSVAAAKIIHYLNSKPKRLTVKIGKFIANILIPHSNL